MCSNWYLYYNYSGCRLNIDFLLVNDGFLFDLINEGYLIKYQNVFMPATDKILTPFVDALVW